MPRAFGGSPVSGPMSPAPRGPCGPRGHGLGSVIVRPAHGTLRFTRTALLAVACTGLAWGGHNLWSDTAAGAGGFLLTTVFLAGLLWRFTRIMRGFGDIFTVMALAQVVLHLVLQMTAAPELHPAGTGHGGHGLLAHTLGLTPGMLFAHLWAALLAAALLAHGESALWFLGATVSRALPRPLGAHGPPFRAPGRTYIAFPTAAPSPPAFTAHGPRGPPGSPAPLLLSSWYPGTGRHGATPNRTRTARERRTMSRTRTAALITPLAAVALLLAPSPALAHDVLTGSDPEDGATLETVPEEIVLTFNNAPMEGGEGSAIVVTGPDGETQYEDGALAFGDTEVTVGLAPLDEAGEYSIAYRVVSSDGHPIQDTITFSVTDEAIAEAAPEEPAEEEPAETEEPAAEEVEESPAAAEEPAAEGSSTTTLLLVGGIATLAVIGLIAVLVVRMRKRPGSGENQ